eukprot:gene20179-biopygen17563
MFVATTAPPPPAPPSSPTPSRSAGALGALLCCSRGFAAGAHARHPRAPPAPTGRNGGAHVRPRPPATPRAQRGGACLRVRPSNNYRMYVFFILMGLWWDDGNCTRSGSGAQGWHITVHYSPVFNGIWQLYRRRTVLVVGDSVHVVGMSGSRRRRMPQREPLAPLELALEPATFGEISRFHHSLTGCRPPTRAPPP